MDLTPTIVQRLAAEDARTAVPPGYPRLPDLPLGRYTHPEYYQAEIAKVFRRSWLFAGHVSDFPEAGSYRILDIPFAPVLAVRGKDDVVRAFLNACRHRGAPVVKGCEGKVRRNLVCGFHSWTYDLSGQLIGVPGEYDFVGLDKDERALTSLRCETWGGFLFVNFDQDAPALSDWLAPLWNRYSDLVASSELRLVDRKTLDVACNWKVAVEAFMETYHLKTIHAESAAPYVEPRQTSIDLFPNGHSTMYLARKQQLDGEAAVNREGFHPSALPEIQGLPHYYAIAPPAMSVFPNVVAPLNAGGFPVIAFWPITQRDTRIEIAYYGPDWGAGPRPEGWDKKLTSFDVLMEEDCLNLVPMQTSIEAAAHKGVPLSYQERRIWHFNAELTRLLGRDSVPEGLEVDDLLAGYVVP